MKENLSRYAEIAIRLSRFNVFKSVYSTKLRRQDEKKIAT